MRIKKLRENAGLQQKELAIELNIPSNTLSQYENGRREPNNAMLKRLASYFKVTTDYLLERESWVQCPVCHKIYDPLNKYDAEAHDCFHEKFIAAEEKYGELMPYQEASELRNNSIKKYTSHSASLDERVNAYGDFLRCDYMIYLMDNGLELNLENFSTYCKKDIGLAETKEVCDKLDPGMYEALVSKYGSTPGEEYHSGYHLNSQEKHVIELFGKLNEQNKKKTISYAENLLSIQKLEEEQDSILTQAACPRNDVEYSAEESESDIDMMSDDKF